MSLKCAAYAFEDGDGLLAQPDRVEHFVVQDGLEQVVLVVGLERRLAGHHLVHEHAQRPPVHAEAVVQLLTMFKESSKLIQSRLATTSP